MAGVTVTNDDDRRRQVDELAEQLIAESGGIDGLLARLGVGPSFEMPELKQPTLLEPRAERAAYVLWIKLNDIEPPIWRQVVVPSDLTLPALHDVMQAVMGWTDSHLHAFRMGPGELDRDVAPFLTPFDIEEGDEGTPEEEVRLDEVLAAVGDRLYYEYDFGDGWEHTIILESVQEWEGRFAEMRCLAGARACPPEDVGGIPGYETLLAVLAGRAHDVDPEWASMLCEWMPPGYDPEHFDVEEVNDALESLEWPTMEGWRPEMLGLIVRMSAEHPTLVRQLAAAVERQELAGDEELREASGDLQLLLETVGADGIKLTQAGYLPPKIVKELFAGLRPAAQRAYPIEPTTEVNTLPILNLRMTAMELGLVRKLKGSLVLTLKGRKVLGNPERLWQSVAEAVPLGKYDFEVDAGLIAIFGVAAGLDPWTDVDTFTELFADAGWHSDGPLQQAFREASSDTSILLRMLGGARVAARLIRGVAPGAR